ncbi:MAG: hypothetical protein V4686_02055 [Patescibacteria group bacterium]
MQSNQGILKKLILVLILIVIGVGVYFGLKFYNASKQTEINRPSANKNDDRTPFQTRTATSGEVIITEETVKAEVINPTPTTSAPLPKPRLVQLWKEPVSGFGFIPKDKEIISTTTATTTIRTATSTTATTTISFKRTILKNQLYIYLWDRATGNVHQNLASTTEVERLSIYTLPRIEEAHFIDPTTVLVRGLDDTNENTKTTYVQLVKDSATSTLFTATEKDVAVNSKFISVLLDTKKMFYFIQKTGQGVVANFDLSSFLRVINTSLTELIPQYVNKTTLAATTKPSAYFEGYLFFINSGGTGDNQYILGDKYGFTTLVSPDGKKVLYSEIQEDLLQTSVYDIQTKTITALTQSTLSEKCAWSADSKKIYCAIPQKLSVAPYPDAWYQGSTSFSDNIWSVDPNTGEFDVIVALQDQLTDPVDAYNLKISSDNKYLIFQDKYSLTLWKYDL